MKGCIDVFPFTCSAIYPSRLFCVRVLEILTIQISQQINFSYLHSSKLHLHSHEEGNLHHLMKEWDVNINGVLLC